MRNGDLDPGDTDYDYDYDYDHDYDRALPALSRSFVSGEGMLVLAEMEIRTTFPTPFPEWQPDRMKKGQLPEKPCAACGRPFEWRRKWKRCWDEVRFCSEACKRGTRALAAPARVGGRL